LSDVANITGDSIDLEKRVITFVPGKTRRMRKQLVIPLHPDLQRVLLEKLGVGKAFLFPSLAGRPTGGKTGLSGQFGKIMSAAGIVGATTRHTPQGRQNKSLSFHSLRHSFNSAMANAGVSQEIRQKLTGHASADMNTIYTHHEIEPLRLAIGKIPGIESR
jgi:integrase